jgi:hypothetical protein
MCIGITVIKRTSLLCLLQGALIKEKRQHSKPLLKTFYNRSRKAVVDWENIF